MSLKQFLTGTKAKMCRKLQVHVLHRLQDESLYIICDQESAGLLEVIDDSKVKVGYDLVLFSPKAISKEILQPHTKISPQIQKPSLKIGEDKKKDFITRYSNYKMPNEVRVLAEDYKPDEEIMNLIGYSTEVVVKDNKNGVAFQSIKLRDLNGNGCRLFNHHKLGNFH